MADFYFRAHRSALNEAIATVFPAVDSRASIPLLGSILFECDGEALRLLGTNLDTQIETTCELLAASAKCAFAIPADRIKAFVSATGESAEITFAPGRLQGQMKISTAASVVSLSYVDFKEFPHLTADDVALVSVNGATLARALKSVSFAVSKRDDRPYLTGICLHQKTVDDEDYIAAVATNGITLARVHCPDVSIPGLPMPYSMPHIILPTGFARELSRLFEKEKDDWKIGASDALVVAETASARIISKLIDGHYPDYERIIPQHEEWIEIATADLRGAIDRMSVVAEEADKEAILLRIKDHRATLQTYNPATGSAREALSIETEIENFEVGFNGAQMVSVLKEVQAKYIRIHLGEEQMRTLLVKPVGSTDEFVVVPMIPKAMPEDI